MPLVLPVWGALMNMLRYRSCRRKFPKIIVSTLARYLIHLTGDNVSPKYIKRFALCKADEMLSHGLKDFIYDIFQKLNSTGYFCCWLHCLLMSSRSPRSSMREPIQILVKKEELTLEVICQCTSVWNKRSGSLTHCVLYDTLAVTQAVIFINTSRKVWLGSLRRCMPGISLFLPCIEIRTKRNET